MKSYDPRVTIGYVPCVPLNAGTPMNERGFARHTTTAMPLFANQRSRVLSEDVSRRTVGTVRGVTRERNRPEGYWMRVLHRECDGNRRRRGRGCAEMARRATSAVGRPVLTAAVVRRMVAVPGRAVGRLMLGELCVMVVRHADTSRRMVRRSAKKHVR